MKTLVLISMFMFGTAALADDGGVIGIKVNDIQFGSTVYDTSATPTKQIFTAIPVTDTTNYEVRITGNESSKLMTTLPPFLTVMTGMYKKFPKWVAQWNANSRGLQIVGKDGQPVVNISCMGGDFDFDHTTENQPPKFTPYPDGAHCTVTLQNYADDTVEYKYDPKKLVCGH